MKQRLEEHTDILQRLTTELQTLARTERLERENLILRLKIELLEMRQLPPPSEKKSE